MENNFTGNITVVGHDAKFNTTTFSTSSNTTLINSGARSGVDAAVMFDRNIADITDYQYQNLFIATTSTGGTVVEAPMVGWIIEVMNGVAVGQKLPITAVASGGGGTMITVAWTIQPSAGDRYRLYSNVRMALVYKAATNTITIGGTPDLSTATTINVHPATLNATLDVSNLNPVGAAGTILTSDGQIASWQSPPAMATVRSATFTVASAIKVNTAVYTTVSYFNWNQTEYGALVDGRMLFNLQLNGATTVHVRLYDEVATMIYASATCMTNGNYSVPITIPSADVLLSVQVYTAPGDIGRPMIYDTVIRFGSTTESISYNITTITASYTPSTADDYIFCNATGPITITLPTVTKKVYNIIDISGTAATNPITILGAMTYGVINKNYGNLRVVSNAVHWYIII